MKLPYVKNLEKIKKTHTQNNEDKIGIPLWHQTNP